MLTLQINLLTVTKACHKILISLRVWYKVAQSGVITNWAVTIWQYKVPDTHQNAGMGL